MLLSQSQGERIGERLVDGALFRATELLAALPERTLVALAEPRLRRRSPWHDGVGFVLHTIRVLRRAWPTLHPAVRRRFVTNIFGHHLIRGHERRRRTLELLGDGPNVMVVSPTMRCNLACEGCYSAGYSRADGLTTERLDRLYDECEALGIHFVVVSGGEPFLRRDTLELFAAHPDLLFMVFTNGTAIADRGLAPRLAELGNVVPCVSVEGFEEETDRRRGEGTHRKVRRAMLEMREAGLLFGFSATPMRHNNDLLVSDRFARYYRRLGCRLGWYFAYVPVGRTPDLALMPTPEQRLHRFHRVRAIRERFDMIAADFWCDGMLTGGCMSGGRLYFHVNAQGGVEPCVFHQFHRDNVNDKPLVDCLASDYFYDVRRELRKVPNPIRPCPVIDNPWMLRELVGRHDARPSQPGGEAILGGEVAAGLDEYAARLAELLDPVFAEHGAGCPWPLDPPGTREDKEAYWRSHPSTATTGDGCGDER